MALFPTLDTDLDGQSALRLPLGAASPLWFAFASAASAGVAYWWMTRWTQPANLEAFAGFAPKAVGTPSVEPAALAPATATALAITAQPTVETPVEAALEPIEAAADTVVETAADTADTAVETVAVLTETAPDVVAEAAEMAIAAADDLTRIVGVGPRLAARLGDLGVKSFKDIAAWTDEDVASFDKTLDLKGRAARDAWVAQARRFAQG